MRPQSGARHRWSPGCLKSRGPGKPEDEHRDRPGKPEGVAGEHVAWPVRAVEDAEGFHGEDQEQRCREGRVVSLVSADQGHTPIASAQGGDDPGCPSSAKT